MAECAAGDTACWQSEWEWKNRWYNARGYYFEGDHWRGRGVPRFANEQVTNEVIADAGISLIGDVWDWANKQKIAYGVAMFGRQLAGGIMALKSLLGGSTTILSGKGCFGSSCAPPTPITDGHEVWIPTELLNSWNSWGGRHSDRSRTCAYH